MMKQLLVAATCLVLTPSGAFAQGGNLENMLDQLDRPGSWQSAPTVMAKPAGGGNFSAPAQMYRQPQMGGMGQQGFGQSPQMMSGQMSPAFGRQPMSAGQTMGSPAAAGSPFSKQNMMKSFFGGQPGGQDAAAANPFSKQNILNAFFGGPGAGSGSTSQGDPSAVGNAQGNLQTALNEASQAESDAERARYGDRGTRMGAASSARYHAGAARAAADRAAGQSYSGPSLARDYAAQARDAANRAQAAADRATYNAEVN